MLHGGTIPKEERCNNVLRMLTSLSSWHLSVAQQDHLQRKHGVRDGGYYSCIQKRGFFSTKDALAAAKLTVKENATLWV